MTTTCELCDFDDVSQCRSCDLSGEPNPEAFSRTELVMSLVASHRQVRVGVGVFVLTPKGYVLLMRQGSHGAGEWSLPGGHLEFSETVEECARREVLEEIGCELEGVVTIPYTSEDFFLEEGKHYITLYVMGITKDLPQILEPHKASELTFFTQIKDLPSPLFVGTHHAAQVLFGGCS